MENFAQPSMTNELLFASSDGIIFHFWCTNIYTGKMNSLNWNSQEMCEICSLREFTLFVTRPMIHV